mmetsp:Transcript_336/g.352  ORF Transcript_336/g.352 Transcript_336/m.352 type:complete len:610 (-) Transcript_336:425-2254(-)|eukprot:CAMPEP_0197847896 /NCGR_PEP_ID=MMETSP1438-20131217/7425_1 /TAXON_ID=1461541 /ORGANISM="Pterosperma sp., Strain CCMP1384" /LENGTH=609 /DNA_ID=CAMNT_0043459961 /DNA_START=92 /DNA_END=1921 /DNA_ORIENTATION=+
MEVPLPKLPGMHFQDPRANVRRKPQTLTYVNGYAVPNDPIAGGVESPSPMPTATAVLDSMPTVETLPAWVAYDRKVLRFNAYFKEAVTESYEENHRIRKCVIYLYLEDESIHVAEPKQQNSGIPQGVFLKRHRIPKDNGGFYGMDDLGIGREVTFYARTFYVVDCDPFTRQFLENSGVEVGTPMPYPDEPIEAYRASLKKVRSGGPPKPRDDDLTRFMEAKLGKASNALCADKLKNFIANDRKVLRFFCVWDDRSSLYGDRRPYVLHYFLADDTVEILEVNEPNAGRDPFPVMLKRAPLPDKPVEVDALGPTKTHSYFTAKDFKVGSHINVYGREFFIHDCDDFTREYCATKLGYSQPDLQATNIREPEEPIPQMELPPYNGFGSQIDTVQNCISLIPKPPKKDLHKLMQNEKKVLRFTAQMVEIPGRTLTNADLDRKFILQYFLADDTVSIFEPPSRNSGIIGGKFLERSTIFKPDSTAQYSGAEFYVGAKIDIHHRTFELLEADDYTYGYMEDNSGVWAQSNYQAVLARVRSLGAGKEEALRGAFIQMDVDGSGFLSGNELEGALKAAGMDVQKQEVITIVRQLDKNGDNNVSIEEFFSAFGYKFED